MAGNNYKIKVTLSDGSIKELPFTAPEGPRGPKGDCRGVSIHKAINAGELQSLVSSMTDTQSVSSIFAVYGNHRQQLVVLGLTATQFTYGFVVTDSPDSETPESIQTISYPLDEAATRFSVSNGSGGTASADYLEVYIYDSETPPSSYLDLSEEADYQLYQANVPGYNWTWDTLPTIPAWTTLLSLFRPGDQRPEVGKSYLALFGRGSSINGLSASVFTVNDDRSITWDKTKRWDLQVGCEVVMPNGAHYKIAKRPTTSSGIAIYDAVTPLVGKIPLEMSGQATNVYFSGLSNVSVSFKVQANSGNAAQGTVFVNSCYNSDYYIDCSVLGTSDGGGTTLLVYLDDKNAAIPTGSQYLGESDFASEHPGVQEYRICNGSWGQDEKYIQTKPFADKPTVLKGAATRFYQNFMVRDSSWVFADGTKLRRDVRISLVGYAPMITRPLVYESASASSLAATPMMAKAMSVEPEMTQEEFNEIVKDKKGVFTIKDNMVYNLLTGEYLM